MQNIALTVFYKILPYILDKLNTEPIKFLVFIHLLRDFKCYGKHAKLAEHKWYSSSCYHKSIYLKPYNSDKHEFINILPLSLLNFQEKRSLASTRKALRTYHIVTHAFISSPKSQVKELRLNLSSTYTHCAISCDRACWMS